MSAYLLYQIANLIMMLAISTLILMLYNRLELKENRALFITAHGVASDLFAYFALNYVTSIEAARLLFVFSIFGRLLYGAGFMGYMRKRYKPKYDIYIEFIWLIGILATASHFILFPNDPHFLSNLRLTSVHGISLIVGDRGVVYFFHLTSVIILGTWAAIVIVKDLVSHRGYRGAIVFNDVFFLVAVITQGSIAIIYDSLYGSVINFLPLFRAALTAVYAFLSVKYHLINFDSLAHKTIMNDMGAGFMVLSEKYDVLYFNEIAKDLYPELALGDFRDQAEDIVTKKEFQLERGGSTYKVSSDRIVTNGHHDGYTVLMVDISDIVQLENQAVLNEIARKNLLTNISHELRTPLNAIIGASEILDAGEIKRETIKEYVERIRIASINLDDILSDILSASNEYDFDKEPDRVPYSICTLVDNVTAMSTERIGGKNINFSVSIAEDIPINAIGDDKRIRHVLLTMLTNAIRYTDEGKVGLKVSGEYLSNGQFKYIYTIQDTGRSVFKEGVDINKAISTGNELGVDYTTGYGISLMVAKRILNSLGGELSVRSVRGKFNMCVASIPSDLLDRVTLLNSNFAKEISVSLLGDTEEAYDELWRACRNLNVRAEIFGSIPLVKKLGSSSARNPLLIFDYDKYGKRVAGSEKVKDYTKVAVLSTGKMPKDYFGKDFIFVRKPVSGITLYKAYLENELRRSVVYEEAAFEAPASRVLVVDDNSINLDVAKGILESFKVQVDTADSGYECLELLEAGNNYDLIFMDYMMEGIDGIETTRRIRALSTSINSVPILAYTANSVEGAKESYLAAGMNGVIYKPASMGAFSDALRKFLPRDYLIFEQGEIQNQDVDTTGLFEDLEDIDFDEAIKYLGGNIDMYREMLASFALEIDDNCKDFLKYETEEDFKALTVLAHGVKGLARTIGIKELSGKMAEFEKASLKNDAHFIHANINDLLEAYRHYKQVFEPYVKEKLAKKESRKPVDAFEATLFELRDQLEDFEMDEAERLFKELENCNYESRLKPAMRELKHSIENIDYYASKEHVDELLRIYGEEIREDSK